jgi:hypothetical protein
MIFFNSAQPQDSLRAGVTYKNGSLRRKVRKLRKGAALCRVPQASFHLTRSETWNIKCESEMP